STTGCRGGRASSPCDADLPGARRGRGARRGPETAPSVGPAPRFKLFRRFADGGSGTVNGTSRTGQRARTGGEVEESMRDRGVPHRSEVRPPPDSWRLRGAWADGCPVVMQGDFHDDAVGLAHPAREGTIWDTSG